MRIALIFLAAAVVLQFGPFGWAGEPKTYYRTYPLQTGDAGMVIQVIKELIGDKKQIVHYKQENQLIISATAEEHKQIEAVLAEINVPSPNVRIDVVTTTHERSADGGAGVKGSGNVVVTKEGPKTRYTFTGHGKDQLGDRSGRNQQTLVVQSGKEASLAVGTEVPFYEYLIWYGTNNFQMTIDQEMMREKVGAFLVAQPQVIGRGPMVSITLTPELRELVGDKRRRIKFTRVSTTVTCRDGETITIGGLGEAQAFYDKFLVGRDAGGTTRSMSMTLTPHIMKGFGAPPSQPAP